MRRWYKYIFSNKIKENINDRFVFTNYTLIYDNDNFEDNFNFEKFKKNKVFYKQYKFLNKSLDSDKETLFIGTRTDVPLTLLLNSGNTFDIDDDAPVLCGMMLLKIERQVLLFE